MDNTNIEIETKVYGIEKNNTSLILILYKNGIQFLHLSIHLSVRYLNPKNTGILHISKNIYKGKTTRKKDRYALISVHIPDDKPKSLIFSIANGYNTPKIKNSNSYEEELQEEMDVIIAVLNNIFNQKNNKYYIGRKKQYINIHKKINEALNNINQHSNHVTRKNKENENSFYFKPKSDNKFLINYNKKTLRKNKSKLNSFSKKYKINKTFEKNK